MSREILTQHGIRQEDYAVYISLIMNEIIKGLKSKVIERVFKLNPFLRDIKILKNQKIVWIFKVEN